MLCSSSCQCVRELKLISMYIHASSCSLSCYVHTDELGVDSHEFREVFLAKIYELSNPSSCVGGMEDDFRCEMKRIIIM